MGHYYKDAKTMAKAWESDRVRDIYKKQRAFVGKLVKAGQLDPADEDAEWTRRVREQLILADLPVPKHLEPPPAP